MENFVVLLNFLAKSWWIWIVGLLVAASSVGWLIRRADDAKAKGGEGHCDIPPRQHLQYPSGNT